MENKTIYNLELHEELTIIHYETEFHNEKTTIIKVYKGWIYKFYKDNKLISSNFVPYIL